MVNRVTQPSITRPITNDSGIMSLEMLSWIQLVTNSVPIVGAGSPETLVEAPQAAFYMDNTGTAGNILYIKRDIDIGGDKTKGWILV